MGTPRLQQILGCLLACVALCLPSIALAETPALRVVSQTVGTDEMLLSLGTPEQIVALSFQSRNADYSAVAEQARAYPQLAANGDAEDVLKHRPTMVLFASYSRPELVAQVRRAGVHVVIFERYQTLDDAYANLRLLAHELGAEAKAERIIGDCEKRVAALRERLKTVKLARVIAPSTYGMIPGVKTTFQDLCDHAGAENLAGTLGHLVDHAPPPAEQMITWPIDFVVLGGNSVDEALRPFRDLPPYQFLPAIKASRAVVLRPHLLSCVTQYRVDGYEELARGLHPELFR